MFLPQSAPPPLLFFPSIYSGRAYYANFVRLNSSMPHVVTLNLYCICYFYFASRLDCDFKQHNMLPFNFIICHLHSFSFFFFFWKSYINGTARISMLKASEKGKNDATNEDLILQLF